MRRSLQVISHATRRRLYAHHSPSVFILGAQKCGTRFLQEHLDAHPGIEFGRRFARGRFRNEMHFFNRLHHRGLDWYRTHFSTAPWRDAPPPLFGDKTPDYLCDPSSPGRLREAFPEAKLVALMRDPVRRAYSHYQMDRRKRREGRSFEAVVDADLAAIEGAPFRTWGEVDPKGPIPLSRIGRGLYAPQLEHWFQTFPRSQFVVLTSEALFAEPAKRYAEVLAFLDQPSWEPEVFVNKKIHPYPPMADATRERLERFYRPWNASLAELLGHELPWS